MNKKLQKKLENYYLNPKQPGSFSGLSTFKNELKNKLKIKDKDLKNWIINYEEYTLHKPARKSFKENKVIVTGIDDTWQADLIDMSKLSKYNKGVKFIITVIDIFSKYAWAVPILNKTSNSIINGFKKIFKITKRRPKRLQTDQGLEFMSKETLKFLKENNISHYFIYSKRKACVIERFNRTLKQKMWRYFTFTNKYEYYDVLDDLLDSYNNTFHRSIKNKPSKIKKSNENETFLNLYGHKINDGDDNILKINKYLTLGTKVRIVKEKTKFEKGYTPNWTDEVFTISEIIYRNPIVYKLKNYHDELLNGVFYEHEIQKINNFENRYTIEKIIKSRIKNKVKQVLVKWKGWDDKYNSWINADAIEKKHEFLH